MGVIVMGPFARVDSGMWTCGWRWWVVIKVVGQGGTGNWVFEIRGNS